nr:immunoglobulin heavy chain junction region [Mus musculus]
CASRANFDYW